MNNIFTRLRRLLAMVLIISSGSALAVCWDFCVGFDYYEPVVWVPVEPIIELPIISYSTPIPSNIEQEIQDLFELIADESQLLRKSKPEFCSFARTCRTLAKAWKPFVDDYSWSFKRRELRSLRSALEQLADQLADFQANQDIPNRIAKKAERLAEHLLYELDFGDNPATVARLVDACQELQELFESL